MPSAQCLVGAPEVPPGCHSWGAVALATISSKQPNCGTCACSYTGPERAITGTVNCTDRAVLGAITVKQDELLLLIILTYYTPYPQDEYVTCFHIWLIFNN